MRASKTKAAASVALSEANELIKEGEIARARLAAIVESSNDAIVSKDLNGVITSWNAAAEQLFGYTAAEAIGRSILMIIPEDRADEEPVILRRIRAGERVEHFETVRRRKDGTRVEISVTISPIVDAHGRIIGASKIARDITERKRVEEMQRISELALKEADRRKDEFLATLAHELRNPLAPIKNAVELLRLSDGKGESSVQIREMLQRQVGQMRRLIDDLLDVSRISRGTIELKRERVELAAAIRSATEISRPAIEKMSHKLSITLPAEPLYLDADPIRLAQMLANLLNNACKFTDPGGRIALTAAREGSSVVLSVKDNGIGIAPEKLPHIFTMFFQVDRSLERSQTGLGIGLTIVYRLAALHGGTVEARSEGVGKGSEFVLTLPCLAEKSIFEAVEAPSDGAAARHRILVADDNADAADSLTTLLSLVGNDVQTARDGQEAVEAAQAFQPEVVLLDIGMPRLNGYEACRRLRQQPRGDEILLIALTGWGQQSDRRRTREAGFDAHMVKPVDLNELMKLLASFDKTGRPAALDG
jgi:two-component system CheB/CheR fusion protein